MSDFLCQLCVQLVGEAFGTVCESVVSCLLASGPRSLRALLVRIKYSGVEVRSALQTLIRHSIVSVSQESATVALYTAVPESAVYLVRCPRYVQCVSDHLGDRHAAMFTRLVQHGRQHTADLIADQADGRSLLCELVSARYVCRCDGTDLFAPPPALTDSASDSEKQSVVWWRIDTARLDNQLRDQLVLATLERTCSSSQREAATTVMRALLHLASRSSPLFYAVSNGVSVVELRQFLSSGKQAVSPKSSALLHLAQFLSVFTQGPLAYCDRCGDSGGGQYAINMRRIFDTLLWSVADDVVRERFGSRALRVYRVVRAKQYVEQDRLQQWAMIPANEAKMLTYHLHGASLLQTYDIRRQGQHTGGNRLSFLLTVSHVHTMHVLKRACEHALLNDVLLRRSRAADVARLRDKFARVNLLIEQLTAAGAADEEQIEQLQEAVSEPERQKLRQEDSVAERLLLAEQQLERTLFVVSTAAKLYKPL